jgi:hypothetical protein
MTEKWMQSKPNPYMSNHKEVRKVRVTHTPKKLSTFSKNVAAHYGMPIQLFKDSDKDKVPNVFDCKPFNKRKQDVVMPQNFGGGMTDMYAKQEAARQQREYMKMLKELQRQEEERAKEQGGGSYVVTSSPTSSSDGYYAQPETLNKSSGIAIPGKYDSKKGGYVTTEGKLYPTKNASWVPTTTVKVLNPNYVAPTKSGGGSSGGGSSGRSSIPSGVGGNYGNTYSVSTGVYTNAMGTKTSMAKAPSFAKSVK